MEKFKYELYENGITYYDVQNIESMLNLEQIRFMNDCIRRFMENCVAFRDIKDRALAEKFFKYGFLTGFPEYTKIKNEL